MSIPFKPEGYTSVAPYLMVNGAEKTMQFLETVFGATRLRNYKAPDGKFRHAEMRIDDTVIMIADSMPEWPAIDSHVHIYVQDVDATYRKALEAGAKSIQAPVKKDDEDKRGGFQDTGGTTWWVGTRVE
jgi:PhnB protein